MCVSVEGTDRQDDRGRRQWALHEKKMNELKMDGEVSKKVSSNKDDYWVQNGLFLCEAEWKTQSKAKVDKPTDGYCFLTYILQVILELFQLIVA